MNKLREAVEHINKANESGSDFEALGHYARGVRCLADWAESARMRAVPRETEADITHRTSPEYAAMFVAGAALDRPTPPKATP